MESSSSCPESAEDFAVIQLVAVEMSVVHRAEAIECAHVPLGRLTFCLAVFQEGNEIQHFTRHCFGQRANLCENFLCCSHVAPPMPALTKIQPGLKCSGRLVIEGSLAFGTGF